uniref:CD62 antigen-like family member L n=1 Tax=Anser cygnoides TaxID=8845 RepID=A0A8B9EJI0_ANSCY
RPHVLADPVPSMVTQVEAWTYSYSNQGIYSWEQARNYCRTFFTDLVAIQNKEEIGYLNATLPFHKQYYWIGIRKQNSVWTWVGTNKALTKEAENWAKGEPNNRRSNQDCVEIYIKRQQEAGKWNDEPCHKRKTALCYKASCQASTCRPHGECVEVIESYRCECHPGFEGDECDTGECLAGSAGGQGDSPSVQCPTLNPKGARMTCSHPFGDFRYNSTCDFVCPEGFERRGAGTLQCLASRQWSAETPTCAGRDCRGLGLGVLDEVMVCWWQGQELAPVLWKSPRTPSSKCPDPALGFPSSHSWFSRAQLCFYLLTVCMLGFSFLFLQRIR